MDGISLFFSLFFSTALLAPICVLISGNSIKFLNKEFLLCLLIMDTIVGGIYYFRFSGVLYIFEGVRIAGNFRGVLIFVTISQVTKFSTHEFSVGYCVCAAQPGEYGVNRTHVLKGSNSYRNGSLSLSTPHRVRRHRSASGVTKFKNTKINSEDPRQLFMKICTPKNYPLYGINTNDINNGVYMRFKGGKSASFLALEPDKVLDQDGSWLTSF